MSSTLPSLRAQAIETASTVPVPDGDGFAALVAKLDICITRTEVAAANADRAACAAERTEKVVGDMKAVLMRMQNDHNSLRHGIPASWMGRLALVGFAAIVGALIASTTVVACRERAAVAATR